MPLFMQMDLIPSATMWNYPRDLVRRAMVLVEKLREEFQYGDADKKRIEYENAWRNMVIYTARLKKECPELRWLGLHAADVEELREDEVAHRVGCGIIWEWTNWQAAGDKPEKDVTKCRAETCRAG